MMELGEGKVSVWVCREEKVVLGLSKRTTCADLVKVLLEDQKPPGRSQSYCIVEKWRGFERILPNKTKILRLWVAWGEERRSVKFVLVKIEASLAKQGARSAEALVVPSKHSPRVSKANLWAPMGVISPERQRRIVRKAFRKLEKINKQRAQVAHRDASFAGKMETLVHLVISQDHTIRQQIQRLDELDAEIERCEAKVHLDRIERHGRNYVQDTYLLDAAAATCSQAAEQLRSAETQGKLEEYVRQCEKLLRLEEELRNQDAHIDIFTEQIQEELNHRWMQRRRASEARSAPENELLLEEERVRTQLDASSYIGLRLRTDLEAIRRDLELTQEICLAREEEMGDLLEKVNILDIEEVAVSEGRCGHGTDDKTGMMSTLESKSEWVEQARGLSNSHNGDDDDSDTGLSSLHSQESDGPPIWESLV
ncbi:ras association domain-containing protein 10 [Aulostomus maculatus]